MTVSERLIRARNDVIKVRENVPNSRVNLKTLGFLNRAEMELNNALIFMEKEHKEITC